MQLTFRNAVRYLALFATSLSLATLAYAQQKPSGAAVTLTEDASAYTLSNGTVTARVDKKSGDLLSMKYKGMEMLGTVAGPDGLPDVKFDKPGANLRGGNHFTDHQYGFWSHDTDSSTPTIDKVTIDPKTNGGARAEVSMKGVSGGKPMGAGPGGSFISDIEIRYALGRGDSGIYTYSIFEHQPDYPASALGEARFCTKLADFFDWMSVGPKWNKLYPKAQPGTPHEDKYDFTADQFDNPAFGWSSTTKHVGIWFLNPSVEYLSGGPTKVEFLGHRDTNNIQAPTVLDYWRSSHYGGAVVDVAQGEHWDKVIGPFMIYANQGGTPQEMYNDAVARAHTESQKWPYGWVNGVDYPHKDERATVSGHLVLKDPLAKGAKMTNIRVGLTAPAYMIRPTTMDGADYTSAVTAAEPEFQIDWQTDAKHYEFWARADANGNFKLTGVRPGNYTLHAFADGVLGELVKTDITVAAGKPLNMGTVEWVPKRYGRQVWEIGVPNRTGEEFAGGDDYAHDNEYLVYAKDFPNDVNYVIGKSDYKTDWFFEQVPHSVPVAAQPAATTLGAPSTPGAPGRGRRGGGGGGGGRATPWTITFNMPQAGGSGKAHLRIAIAGNGAKELDVALNDQPIGVVDHLFADGSIGRNGIHGVWSEHDVVFDESMLKPGTNVIKLTIPGGSYIAGVIYDYLRLEVE